ncbi:dihydrofolate reductase [Dasania sp. GY-MA-18]|uniref:Dihydrofolate reductase n=1 Tax=Dasania phycosphaerae TaxID=2950436 RepID=A0A9J6RK69_9GAMM|nr:dihydrofolate reductase [Dasania sp. GY-MA-18]MCZ0864624.1 dihydrofolate reductase [Dasania phycosphaerae]MCZ0868352.1 dihydrofolate reductase [Dasania phycosphaerae]
MKISMIVAVAENGVIGRNNQLPWYLPEDLKYFKRVTMAKPIVMGRKTFESIGRPLPGRSNIVVTRNTHFSAEGVKVVGSIDEAIKLADDIAVIDGAKELMIIGGAQLYADILPKVDRLYLTEVHAVVEGDAFFPEIDREMWREVAREKYLASGPNTYDYSFVVLDRCKNDQ